MNLNDVLDRLRAIDTDAMRDKKTPTDWIVVNAIEELIDEIEEELGASAQAKVS